MDLLRFLFIASSPQTSSGKFFFLRITARIISFNDRKLQLARCKQNKAGRFPHSSSPGSQCLCFWLFLKSQVSATYPFTARLLPTAPGPLLWLSAPALAASTTSPSPSRLISFPFLPRLQEKQPFLLRGLQHELEQMRQLWSYLTSSPPSLNLNTPFQTCRRKVPGCRGGLRGEKLLKPSH